MSQEQSTSEAKSIAAGEPKSWLAEHGDALFRYALLRVSDRNTAEDLVQETFLAALKSRDSFRGDCAVRTWLISILRFKIIDQVRADQKSREQELPDGSDEFVDGWFNSFGSWAKPLGSWRSAPPQLLEQREFWDVLRHCLEGIPEKPREVFAMRMISDVSADEVCKVLDISSTNLWVLLHRARARLRGCLEINWFERKSSKGSIGKGTK
jgi:RNA polymerase sigma-70 factor (ECF subfamily)